jgi:HK97 family phage prohead protease
MTSPASTSSALAERIRGLARDERPREQRSAVHYLSCPFRSVKAVKGDGEEMRFEGYGAYFDNIDAYGDAIQKGAFRRTLREAKKSNVWPLMLSAHGGWGLTAEDLTPVGLWEALDEDEKGLFSKGVLAPTPRGSELYALLSMRPRPALSGLSIGYVPRAWKTNADPAPGEPRRVLTDVDLYEISLVGWPANDRARVTGVKSARDLEATFRALGLSTRESKRAASAAWRALNREPESQSPELASLLRASAAKFAAQ